MIKRSHFAIRCCVLVLVALVGLSPSRVAAASESVIAVADVHGDFDDFAAILQRAGLIDQQSHWAGGSTTFVQTGDLLDRGPKPRQAMDLVMALQKEAPKAGGHVISLLGNHEVMNLMGDLRYVTTENYASYADADSEKRRDNAFRDYIRWQKSHAQILQHISKSVFEINEEQWRLHHPAGFLEQRDAFAANGKYGRWLRERPAVAEVATTIFLHGGIAPELTSLSLDAINQRIRSEIQAFDAARQYLVNEGLILPYFTLEQVMAIVQAETDIDAKAADSKTQDRLAHLALLQEYGSWLSVREDGPLWFRGYDRWSDEEGPAQIAKVLDTYHATRIVVGHTVQNAGTIRPRFQNKVFLIDTGMLASVWPGGRASALKIQGNKITAEYVNQEVDLTVEAGSGSGVQSKGGEQR